MTKAYSRFLTACFCIFLGGLLVWHVALPDRERSEVENRTLAQKPEFSWEGLKDGSYTAAVEEYFADQFPLRDGWTGLKARAEQFIGKREFHDVFLCEDTLISQVQPPSAELVDKNLSYVQRLADKTDANVYLGLIPSAAEVWKDKLPDGAQSWDQQALLDKANELGLPTVDFYTELMRHHGEPIFYRTDHHWTTLGASYGYIAVMDALGRSREEAVSLLESLQPQTVTEDFNGTLYSQSGIHWLESDSIQFWVPEDGLTVTSWRTGAPQQESLYDRSYLTQKDKYSAFLGGNQPLCVIKNENITDGSKILLIRDSYSDSLAPFLAQSFSEVHLLDLRYYRAPASAYAAENGIDDIVVLYSIPNFITDKNLVFLAQ